MEKVNSEVQQDLDKNSIMFKTIQNMQNQLEVMSQLFLKQDSDILTNFSDSKKQENIIKQKIVRRKSSLGLYGSHKYNELSKKQLIDLLNEKIIESENKEIANEVQKEMEQKNRKFSNDFKLIKEKYEIYKIILTGGPCAGKTTAISSVADRLREYGFTVFIIPEAASMIFQSGGNIMVDSFSIESQIRFQYYLMMMQMSLEDIFKGVSTSCQNKSNIVLLCDRGTMDGSAYVSKEVWNRILTDYDLNLDKIRDQRYDMVIHLSTAADGAEKFYSLNNQARHETVEVAMELDKKLQEAWMDHPNFVQVNNKDFSSFNEKLDEVNRIVCQFLGIPTTVTFLKKLIVSNPDGELIDYLKKQVQNIHSFEITDVVFIREANKVTYYRKRKAKNLKYYVRCEKSFVEGIFSEKRRQINLREYQNMRKQQSSSKYIIKKTRDCFMYEKNYFLVDNFKLPDKQFSVCIIQGYKGKTEVTLPEIIEKNVALEVHEDYVNFLTESIAQNSEINNKIFTKENLEKLKKFNSQLHFMKVNI